jgi:chromosome segregation protein
MEDVIFAGTAGRAALGRAEVTLTIDNSDGALPIEYTEVSITRRMYRSGESEYEINGDKVRLLDVQELLSDSGIGREMHVIVGQGQLDAVLSGRPEDRRAFIEEAAGVLKHRKRKEKALRKLDGMQANLDRLADLTAELRRQLKPLGRQAEVARRAAGVQAELRDARLRLLADDLVQLRQALDRDVADEAAARARRTQVEADLAAVSRREAALEAELAASAPMLQSASDTWYRLSALSERFRSVAQLAAERQRHLVAVAPGPAPGRDPDQLDAEAARAAATEAELAAGLAAERGRLATAVAARAEREAALAEAERAWVAAAKALADRREGLARLSGEVAAAGSRVTAGRAEIDRLAVAAAEAADRARAAADRYAERRGQGDAQEDADVALVTAHDDAVAAHAAAALRVTELIEAERAAERDRASWAARRDALALGLHPADGAGAVLGAGLAGVVGPLAEQVSVRSGDEVAVGAALGSMADAVVVAGVPDAAGALRWLADSDGGRAGLLVTGGLPPVPRDGWPELPEGSRWALDALEAPPALVPALSRALERVAVVPHLDAAVALVTTHPRVRAVTATGDLVGADWAVGGRPSAPSNLVVRARVEEAERELGRAAARAAALGDELDAARAAAARRSADVEAAAAARQAADRSRSALAAELASLGAAARSAEAEADRHVSARARAEAQLEQSAAALAALEQRLAQAESAPVDEEPPTAERDGLRAEAAAARQAETEARLAVRTAEERARSLHGRAESLRRQARHERAARDRAAAVRAARERGASVAAAVCRDATTALAALGTSVARAAAERDRLAAGRTAAEAELLDVRARVRAATADLERLTDEVHRDEVARAEQRYRIEALEERAAEEYGVDLPTLLAEYGPTAPVPASPGEGAAAGEAEGAERAGEPYDRAVQERRAARAERDLATLGKVNPLALEEFAALEERHGFLATQLEDLKSTRRDLLTVVREVDARIHDVFASAFADVATEFESVFATLFPGGHGRLVLTEPDDLLTTGVEVEARPPGKKVKRLSLLSGGERSLTAVALLVAIFRARPSPFYVLDEVEAALDDVNLGRLLTLVEQLRSTSQLIVITHQRRTMEIADALYGVSMRGDGITGVISQRLRELETA